MGDRIVLGSDHRGFALKQELSRRLAEAGFDVRDLGPGSEAAVDYPDFAAPAARAVSEGDAPRAIVICGTGLGVTYTANRFPRVRAALVHDVESAALARRHNDANVLALSGDRTDPETAWRIVSAWLETPFEGGRHEPRVAKIDSLTRTHEDAFDSLAAADPEIRRLLRREARRQAQGLELRAGASYVSEAVLEALGSVLANRTASADLADETARIARERACALFGAGAALVRPASARAARRVLLRALLQPGDALLVLGEAGGAEEGEGLRVAALEPDAKSGRFDYGEVRARATQQRPRALLCRSAAQPRALDYDALRAIADEAGALLLVDLGALAGLVAGGALASPVGRADAVAAATDGTLRGPRGGLVLCAAEQRDGAIAAARAVLADAPAAHELAARAVALREAAAPAFRDYAAKAVANARALAAALAERGLAVVSGGTDTHCVLVSPVSSISATPVAELLALAGIRAGARGAVLALGCAALTARGFGAAEMREIAEPIAAACGAGPFDPEAARVRTGELCRRFPLYPGRWSDGD